MKRIEILKEMLKELETVKDIYVDFYEDTKGISIQVNDFDGFDDNYDEVERELVKPDLVEKMEDFLYEQADEKDINICEYYKIDGYDITLDYLSADI
jgi:hypothetical protein